MRQLDNQLSVSWVPFILNPFTIAEFCCDVIDDQTLFQCAPTLSQRECVGSVMECAHVKSGSKEHNNVQECNRDESACNKQGS